MLYGDTYWFVSLNILETYSLLKRLRARLYRGAEERRDLRLPQLAALRLRGARGGQHQLQGLDRQDHLWRTGSLAKRQSSHDGWRHLRFLQSVFLWQEGVSIVFDWQSEPKKYGSMFVGTVPELDLAVYTICFLAR